MKINSEKSSFRDPSGYILKNDKSVVRVINNCYRSDYKLLMNSGLYNTLVGKRYLISHRELDSGYSDAKEAYKIIEPEFIPFISYPFEWSFSQLKDAALLTLKIQRIALRHQMSLKDASAYNVQFFRGKPIFIDTLSFEKYKKGRPWIAYKQFCQHFLAPLALMSMRDIRLNRLLAVYMDGIPLDLASRLLPFRSKLSFSLLLHVHLHAVSQSYFKNKSSVSKERGNVSLSKMYSIIDSLESAVKCLKFPFHETEWGEYYSFTNYNTDAFEHKKQIINKMLDRIKPQSLWDLGANNGLFSRIASARGIETIAFDMDPVAVESDYLMMKQRKEEYILPVLVDLTNPSPSIGWANEERQDIVSRGPTDVVMALALIHHIAISNNLPMEMIASYFRRLGRYLIIEFVPKIDSQVSVLLSTRDDIFPDYNEAGFESAFEKSYKILEKQNVKQSERTIYLMDGLK